MTGTSHNTKWLAVHPWVPNFIPRREVEAVFAVCWSVFSLSVSSICPFFTAHCGPGQGPPLTDCRVQRHTGHLGTGLYSHKESQPDSSSCSRKPPSRNACSPQHHLYGGLKITRLDPMNRGIKLSMRKAFSLPRRKKNYCEEKE